MELVYNPGSDMVFTEILLKTIFIAFKKEKKHFMEDPFLHTIINSILILTSQSNAISYWLNQFDEPIRHCAFFTFKLFYKFRISYSELKFQLNFLLKLGCQLQEILFFEFMLFTNNVHAAF